MRKSAHHSSRAAANSRRIGLFAISLNLLFWGFAPAIIKSALERISPEVFLYYRFLIVTALSTPFIFLFRKTFSTLKTPKHLAILLCIGLLTNPLSLGLLFWGLTYTTSLAGAILSSTAPLFIILGSALFLKERVTKHELLGVVIASIGTAFIVLETPVQEHALNPVLGNSLILLQNVVWTAGVLLMKKLAQKHSPFLFGYTGWLSGMVVFFFVALATHPQQILQPLMLVQWPEVSFPIVYMAIFGSLIAFTSYQIAQKHLTASETSIFEYLLPIIALPLSLFWLNERFGSLFFAGAAFLTIGVTVAEMHPSSRLKALFSHRFRRNTS